MKRERSSPDADRCVEPSSAARERVGIVGAMGVAVAIVLAGCAPTASGPDLALSHTVGGEASAGDSTPPVEASTVRPEPPASEPPVPHASVDAPRAMEVGDCLNKVAVDELGLPIPQYIDCDQPHMFEVTAVVDAVSEVSAFNFEAIDDARKAHCRNEYESYTGRDSRDMGNAFGWDQLSERAWDAGETSYSCYATAPGFGDLTGSVAS
ncbi:septum formation family protein [Demequina oxidasica]|uniref:septum formation family protein n=1 Tax=Demequina oxidasica TaxID=676199 RepID=UPI001F2FD907|nr:septum formation family protein [Demequina oxidasica]